MYVDCHFMIKSQLVYVGRSHNIFLYYRKCVICSLHRIPNPPTENQYHRNAIKVIKVHRVNVTFNYIKNAILRNNYNYLHTCCCFRCFYRCQSLCILTKIRMICNAQRRLLKVSCGMCKLVINLIRHWESDS